MAQALLNPAAYGSQLAYALDRTICRKKGLFGQTLNEIYPDREKSITPDEARGMLVRLHQTLLEGLERRKTAARMTGEWIIYYQYEGRNYYLDIALHSEQANEQALYDRLNESCAWEFPFAFQ